MIIIVIAVRRFTVTEEKVDSATLITAPEENVRKQKRRQKRKEKEITAKLIPTNVWIITRI
jgi:hypothetical protein